MDTDPQELSAAEKTILVEEILRGEKTPQDVCDAVGLEGPEVEAWIGTYRRAGERALQDRTPLGPFRIVLDKRIFLPDPTTKFSDIDWGNFTDVISAFEKRIEQWYIQPTRVLAENDNFGFAVMAISCLLVDMISQYELGLIESDEIAFKRYLRRAVRGFGGSIKPSIAPGMRDFADALWTGFRCPILHEAGLAPYCAVNPNYSETIGVEPNLTEWASGDECSTVVINPNRLADAVARAFREYITRLRKPSESDLRTNFKLKFEASFGLEIGDPA